jgi:hypothetical protein
MENFIAKSESIFKKSSDSSRTGIISIDGFYNNLVLMEAINSQLKYRSVVNMHIETGREI